MWGIDNQTPYSADRTFARDAEGAEVWIVAVRATFVIDRQGRPEPAGEQLPVCQAPKHHGEPGRSSLRFDSDLVRTKPGTDLVLNACAYAPGGRPAPFVEVAFGVGGLEKSLRVCGNRVWKDGAAGLAAGDPEPFVTLPVVYERALGGRLNPSKEAPRDPANPVGIGRIAVAGHPVPNVEYPDSPIRSPRQQGPPAGFGAVPCDWQPRAGLAGTYDEAWKKTRQPLVPSDFKDEYFRCAPADQQARGFLQGGEEVVLRNLTPEGLLRFRLPRVRLGFRTRIAGGITDHRGQLHTVILEPADRRLIMVWQTALPCHPTLYTLKETVVFEKEEVPLGGLRAPASELAV